DGKGWTQQATPTGMLLKAVWGSGPDDVWAVGETILHTTGASAPVAAPTPPPSGPELPATWSALQVKTTAPLSAVWGTGGSLFLVGQKGQILHSVDEGATFTAQKSGTGADLHAVYGTGRN